MTVERSDGPAGRLCALVGRHPAMTDMVVAVLVAALTLPVTIGGDAARGVLEPGGGVIGLSWLWFAAVHIPLIWRRRNPVVVFWLVFAVSMTSVLGGVTGVFVVSASLVALYTVARHRPSSRLWPAFAATVLATGLACLHAVPEWPTVIGTGTTLVAVVSLGVALRLRADYLERRDRLRRRESEQRETGVVAAERARIAREVHDIVAHNLAVMVALADGALATIDSEPERAGDMVAKTAATGRSALGEMRRLVGLLRDQDTSDTRSATSPFGVAELSPSPGIADLEALAAQVRAAGLDVTLVHDGGLELAPGVGLAVYRILQEALTNTLKHAGPKAVTRVVLRRTASELELEVLDDGAGRRAAAPGADGHGLAGITERAAAYGGVAQAGPLADAGWRVHITLRA